MKKIEVNKQHEEYYRVEEKHSARNFGSGFVDVLSTPALIGFMEKTCNDLLHQFLEENEVSVGIEVNVKHIKATKIGDTIRCLAEIINAEKNKISFRVEAFDSAGKIGEGTHKRAVVDKERFKL